MHLSLECFEGLLAEQYDSPFITPEHLVFFGTASPMIENFVKRCASLLAVPSSGYDFGTEDDIREVILMHQSLHALEDGLQDPKIIFRGFKSLW